MARSRTEGSGSWPLIGTSDATSARAVGVKGGTLVPRKGSGKTKDPSVQPVGRRSQTKESSGARYVVTETRAYPAQAEGLGRNVYMLPSSHGQRDTWRSAFDGLGPEPD